MTEIAIPPHETPTIRLLSGTFPSAAALKAYALPGPEGWPLAEEAGAEMDPGRVEAFMRRDLGELGLAGYLEEGLGVPLDRLAGAPLDEVGEAVVVLHPRVLGDGGGVLRVPDRLRYHGAFTEGGWEPGLPPVMPKADTLPAGGEVDAAEDPEVKTPPALPWGLALAGTVVLVLLLTWIFS
ncbi:hypothetical protein BCF33_2482 [Hasllibacter halocynthiae]|uniref:Aspartate carbamoyltransferase catalytic subunit n=1 Tax=Hasllibacter halocynthiae TaxID=595589 RepID=A0A2T0X3T2_9RHOB|nr:hypothetical protein [Hasllibacter halocynthiae]PRY93602.1 hypothetical protein BCF33_2482 [Hasllibacter halocynthiae]